MLGNGFCRISGNVSPCDATFFQIILIQNICSCSSYAYQFQIFCISNALFIDLDFIDDQNSASFTRSGTSSGEVNPYFTTSPKASYADRSMSNTFCTDLHGIYNVIHTSTLSCVDSKWHTFSLLMLFNTSYPASSRLFSIVSATVFYKRFAGQNPNGNSSFNVNTSYFSLLIAKMIWNVSGSQNSIITCRHTPQGAAYSVNTPFCPPTIQMA